MIQSTFQSILGQDTKPKMFADAFIGKLMFDRTHSDVIKTCFYEEVNEKAF